MMKISDLGLSNNIELAQKPTCGAECSNCEHIKTCNPKIMATNFKSQGEVLGFATGIANEWDCPHTFIFVKFKDDTCAVGFHECVSEDEEKYEWDVRKIQWKDIKKIRSYISEFAEIHFAVVLEEDKEGNFSVITK